VAHPNWAETSQERIESVVDRLKIVDVCNILIFVSKDLQLVELKLREGKVGEEVGRGSEMILGFIGTVFAVQAMVK
jgi:hypothetical protein